MLGPLVRWADGETQYFMTNWSANRGTGGLYVLLDTISKQPLSTFELAPASAPVVPKVLHAFMEILFQ